MTYKKWFGENSLLIICGQENNQSENWIWFQIVYANQSPYRKYRWIAIDRDTANIFKGCYQADFMAPFIDRLQEINNDPEVAKLLEEAALLYAS